MHRWEKGKDIEVGKNPDIAQYVDILLVQCLTWCENEHTFIDLAASVVST